MNQLSTARFVSPSVYIGFRLFVLQESHLGDVSSFSWKVRGRFVSPTNSFIGIQSCPIQPRRPARGVSGFTTQQIKMSSSVKCAAASSRFQSAMNDPFSKRNTKSRIHLFETTRHACALLSEL